MFSTCGSLAGGKKIITKAKAKNINAPTLMGSPNLPNEKYEGSKGWDLIRLQAIEPIDIMYEASRAVTPRAVSWLKAMVEPKLMDIRRMEKMEVVMRALRGMSYTTCKTSQHSSLYQENTTPGR